MSNHLLLYACASILLLLFIIYVFLYNHKQEINDSLVWVEAFSKVGINPRDMTHDDTTWYYRGRTTCVGYGDWTSECPKYENYCAGNKVFGTPFQQVFAIKESLDNGGTHGMCPIIYAGAN